MATSKPTKPSSSLPTTWGGTKTAYTSDQISSGYSESVPTIVDGGNVNYEKQGVFERIDYLTKTADIVNAIPSGKVLTVDSNNKFDYKTPAMLASNAEYSTGTSTTKSPTVKQVKDNLAGVITEQEVDAKISTATAQLQPKLPTIEEGQILVFDGTNYVGEDQMAGIPPSYVLNKTIKKTSNSVSLTWTDPADTFSVDGNLICSWKGTKIVKKQGSYPANEKDGTEVVTITTRNQYAETAYVDSQANASQWYYKAFPFSANNVYCRDVRNGFGVIFCGFDWDKNNSDPNTCISYPDGVDNRFWDPCYMNATLQQYSWGGFGDTKPFMSKPCLLSFAGTVTKYLDVNDNSKDIDGNTVDLSQSANGNFMAEFEPIYRKKWRDSNNIEHVRMSNVKIDDSYECYSAKKSDGTYANFYLPMFEGTKDSSNRLRSCKTDGKPLASTTAANERTFAQANGANWDICYNDDWDLLEDLFLLYHKNTNSQATLGYVPTSSSALTTNTGTCIQKGENWGLQGSGGIKFFNIENPWTHRWNRMLGLINNKGTYYVKHTRSTVDGSTVSDFNLDGSGYINTGLSVPSASESYIRDHYMYDGLRLPRIVSGSSTTYTCDGMWSNNGQIDMLIRGGAVDHGAVDGVFCFNVNGLASTSNWGVGASLSYHS